MVAFGPLTGHVAAQLAQPGGVIVAVRTHGQHIGHAQPRQRPQRRARAAAFYPIDRARTGRARWLRRSHRLRGMSWSVDVAEVLPATVSPLPRVLAAAVNEAMARPAAQQPAWPDPDYLARVRRVLEAVPPIAVACRGRQAPGAAWRGRPRRGVPVAGWGLRGDVRRQHRGAPAWHDPDAVADGGRLDVRNRRCPSSRLGGSPGQYAKPRSADTDAAGLPSYRGDMVHGLEPTRGGAAARTPAG